MTSTRSGLDIGQQALQRGPFEGAAGETAVVVAVWHDDPALAPLTDREDAVQASHCACSELYSRLVCSSVLTAGVLGATALVEVEGMAGCPVIAGPGSDHMRVARW